MEIGQWVAGVVVVVLAVAHSVLGESDILKPLFADERWDIGMARWASERLLRFAWHLTSIAWIGLAAIALGLDPLVGFALVAFVTAFVIFFMLRGHLAWPLALLAAGAALWSAGLIPNWSLVGLAYVGAAVALILSIVHAYWAAGGERWLRDAIPISKLDGSDPIWIPPPWMAGAVAVLLAAFALLLVIVTLSQAPSLARVPTAIGGAVLVVRAVGDGKFVGFTKRVRASSFARRDDQYFTPTAVLMAFSAGAALLS